MGLDGTRLVELKLQKKKKLKNTAITPPHTIQASVPEELLVNMGSICYIQLYITLKSIQIFVCIFESWIKMTFCQVTVTLTSDLWAQNYRFIL